MGTVYGQQTGSPAPIGPAGGYPFAGNATIDTDTFVPRPGATDVTLTLTATQPGTVQAGSTDSDGNKVLEGSAAAVVANTPYHVSFEDPRPGYFLRYVNNNNTAGTAKCTVSSFGAKG